MDMFMAMEFILLFIEKFFENVSVFERYSACEYINY